LAHEGTLFLDEIGDLPIELQAKLLRVLQDGEFERLGSTETRTVNVRLVTATNRDLGVSIREGSFREDLYYRLNVFPIHLPPLRLRKSDIPALAQHFVIRYAARTGSRVDTIPTACMDQLISYDWPGNIRELENVIERALILSRGTSLRLEENFGAASHLGALTETAPVPRTSLNLRDTEIEMIREALRLSSGKLEGKAGAAALLGIASSTLRDRLTRYNIKR
jgi:formate hydrogenlyase transcriptional activator